MATTPTPPPDQPHRGYGYSPGAHPLAGMTLPVNPELVVAALVVLIVMIITLASDSVDANGFVLSLTFISVGYLLSRGIAKASRVLEH